MATQKVHIDMSKLSNIIQRSSHKAAKIVQKIAQDTETDVKNNFSRTSPDPSPPGSPPAVQTGFLKNSIRAEPVPGTDNLHWTLQDYTSYGVFLEYGTVHMAARPFFRPALNRALKRLPSNMAMILIDES